MLIFFLVGGLLGIDVFFVFGIIVNVIVNMLWSVILLVDIVIILNY